MNELDIAKEIKNQIDFVDPSAWFAWGANSAKCLREGAVKEGGYFAGLHFEVTGLLFQGVVRVYLMYSDTYTIQLGNFTDQVFMVSKTVQNVYCDDLMCIIDGLIELKK